MGSDDLFRKRKAKTLKNLERRKARRNPFKRILVVCEGSKTEPYYFEEIRKYYKINKDLLTISGDCGSSPNKVIEHGKELYLESKNGEDQYDKVFCVIDKDKHRSYNQALTDIRNLNLRNNETFVLINSVPCFEYWLLLHFEYTTVPFSSSEEVLRKLKKHINNYDKGQKGLFNQLEPKLKYAIENSRRAANEAYDNDTDTPSTKIHELVEYILKEQARPD